MNEDLISVLMSTYNEPVDYVKRSIDSITGQTYKKLEIIIVLDNPDNTELCEFVLAYAKKDGRIKVIKNKINRGLVYSLNKALSEATGEYIARMDADDISKANRIEKQLAFLKANKLDLVGSNVTDIDEYGNIIHQCSRFPEHHSNITEYLRYNDCIPHPTWLGKHSVFSALKGYREIDACEDYDFLVRAVLKGCKLGVYQKPLLCYRINSNGISSTKRAKQKTSLYIIKKYYRAGSFIPVKKYQNFMSSPDGQKKQQAFDSYYQMSAKLKAYKGNKAKYLLYGSYLFCVSAEARGVVIDQLAVRKLRSR